MPSGLASWSKTAGDNATADTAVNFAEGQAPSSLNDSCRALMASAAKFRDDISGGLTTAGTSTAYTVTTNQGFASLAALNTRLITIVPHTTSGADPTLAVDGLAAKQIRTATGVNVPSGSLVAGTPYALIYFNGTTEFILLGFDANPYMIPLGGVLPYFGTTAPHSNYALAFGQAISRTTYAALFSLFGTTYGPGDGSTTFNLPDLRGRVLAGKDDMGGVSANRLTNQSGGLDGDVLGATGGAETHTLTEAQLVAHTHGSPSVNDPGHTHTVPAQSFGETISVGSTQMTLPGSGYVTGSSTTGITLGATTQSTGSGAAHNNVQPTIIVNYILRII